MPTDRRCTGQRETGVGFYDYQARLYDPSLGRFISADSIVPEPGQPQSLNRYGYVLGNPLKYIDPTGNYSEEEIMQSFGVSTWDEVLALFDEKNNSFLAGLWGWLFILRQANDGDFVSGDMQLLFQRDAAGPWPPYCKESDQYPVNAGVFGRDDQGHILVSGQSNVGFAVKKDLYSLWQSYAVDHDLWFSFKASTWATDKHYHLYFDSSKANYGSAALDIAGIATGLFTFGVGEKIANSIKVGKTLKATSTALGGASFTLSSLSGFQKPIMSKRDVAGLVLSGVGVFIPVGPSVGSLLIDMGLTVTP